MTHSARTLLLNRLQAEVVICGLKRKAPEQALLALMFSQDQKLVRDCSGHWNHPHARRQSSALGGKWAPFQTGFTDRTIRKLIEIGRACETKFDSRGESVEVVWVAI